jgi:2-desacetyl-2-hydroxyethyl bacteriochlorophyllide A dehydrogenase
MPRELVAIGPRQPELREYEESPIGPGEVRVKSEFSSPKHGTESSGYRGTSPFATKNYDPQLEIFLPREGSRENFPMRLGNMTVGSVTEVGKGVTKYSPGDRVFGHLPIRETHTVKVERLASVPDGMMPEQIVYWDPAEFALGAVRDANVRLGEVVAVFGLGAIGFMVLEMARLSGAGTVIVVDPLKARRRLASDHGADETVDPTVLDAGQEIRRLTRKGVDVAIEASGSYEALHQAIRATHVGGLVVPLAFYQGDARGLFLGEEWHMNRITMRSSRSISDPNRDHPMWNQHRIKEVAFELLRSGRISVEGLVTPVVPFADCAEAYREADENPEACVKMGVTYG